MKLITKSDFARITECSPATITRAAKGALKPAIVVDRIDADHPVARAFVELHRATEGR